MQWYILRERLQWSKWVGVQVYIHNSVFMWVLVYVNSKQLYPSLLSQFLYYADNLVSHQPERIPPLQREGGDVLSTTRLFWWAKVEDIRTLEC